MLQSPWARSELFHFFVCIAFITAESSFVISVLKHLGCVNNSALLQMLAKQLWMKARHVIQARHSQQSSSDCQLSYFEQVMLSCGLYVCDSSKKRDCADLYTS